MKSLVLLATLHFASLLCIGQDLKFAMPLKGVAGKDFFIDYYADHDVTDGFHDVYCGTKTYDGHMGTDFVIAGYKKMDSGVYIYMPQPTVGYFWPETAFTTVANSEIEAGSGTTFASSMTMKIARTMAT